MASLGQSVVEGASSGNPQLLQVLKYLLAWQKNSVKATGLDPSNTDPNAPSLAPPPQIQDLQVIGKDGKFTINITPADTTGTVFYTIQSSSSIPFRTSQDVTTYGPTPSTTFEVQAPNETLYWRVTSSFASSLATPPFYYSQGPVSSGTLTSASNSPLNTTMAAVENQPSLIQGLDSNSQPTTTIDIGQTIFQMGGNIQITYNSGIIDVGSYGLWHVYANDPQRLGGSVIYQASQSLADVVANDGNVYFGHIILTEGIAAIGSGTGNGLCPAAGSQVLLSDKSLKSIELLKKGDKVYSVDGGVDTLNTDPVMIVKIPCVGFTTLGGLIISGRSVDDLIMMGNGNFNRAGQVFIGDQVMCFLGAQNVVDTIATKSFLGMKSVFKLSLSRTKLFNADGLWSHNKDDYDFAVSQQIPQSI